VYVHRLGFGEKHLHVLIRAENGADRLGDIAGREDGRGHLIEERLKEVVVAAVEDGDGHAGPRELPGRVKPAEAASDDHDMWFTGSSGHENFLRRKNVSLKLYKIAKTDI